MKFYDALQLDPAILKRKSAACGAKREKAYYWAAIAARSVLIVSFAIVFISLLSNLFGADNTPLAVALFCMMLGIRFVNFEYCAGDSLLTLAAALAILVLAPSAAAAAPAVLLIPLHFGAFFALLYITTQRPEMGNGGLYSFAYIYLTGNPVFGEALLRRGLLAVVGFVICGGILLLKHRGQHKATRFHHVVRRFDLTNPVHLWQLRMALGVSLVLTAGQVFGVERFMWMGFACASLLSAYPYSGNTSVRFRQRLVGAAAGCGAFFLLYLAAPEAFHPLMGPLGGLCLGFCTDYRYKTAMNCFGVLMLGAGIYGLQGAVILRMVDTFLGVSFGLVFAALFHRLAAVRLLPQPEGE
ncbi:FUSC family protein [Pseudoflavonifractor phocaeensis]|uniref:FUSC family protein n=1 Tax=Pseudoflavonifractor phocaeensis TaxID=1870988 RepID=UPI00195A8344|nr:FUSC family protein [Pseudoflavonifractor phocaeensis]MBM6721857.1 FUSC family protein [Pseudoflavonifractor phocaeensis]